jgi:hypothetical protein
MLSRVQGFQSTWLGHPTYMCSWKSIVDEFLIDYN